MSDTNVVADSVGAYSAHVAAYTDYNADKMADQVAEFTTGLPAGAAILDAGCGPGRDLARFTSAGFTTTGVDLNPDFVATASEHGTAVLGDLRHLPFDDESFDAVWACASLVHLPDDDTAAALAEIARVVRSGGRVSVGVKTAGTTGWSDTAHGRRWFNIWTPQRFTAAVQAAGLTVNRVTTGPVFVDVWATRP